LGLIQGVSQRRGEKGAALDFQVHFEVKGEMKGSPLPQKDLEKETETKNFLVLLDGLFDAR